MPSLSRAQGAAFGLGIWQFNALQGHLATEGRYTVNETRFRNDKSLQLTTKNIFAEIDIKNNSYIWHPNFLTLDISALYSPGTLSNKFLVTPERNETRTISKLDGLMTLFSKKPVSLTIFGNRSNSKFNREFTTNVKLDKQSCGVGLSIRNRFLPIQLNARRENWKQVETATGRRFTSNSSEFRARANKSFSRYDQAQLKYSYKDYKQVYPPDISVHNYLTDITFEENIFLNEDQTSQLNSRAWYNAQDGHQQYDRLQLQQGGYFALPFSFNLGGSYMYQQSKQSFYNLTQKNARLNFGHQLYKSLSSRFTYENLSSAHSDFDEQLEIFESSFNYQKDLPGGKLQLFYSHRKRKEHTQTHPGLVYFPDEEHQLASNEVVLLENPDVDLNSVVVSDYNHTIIYQLNIDYVLIPRGRYLEIQRLPGGQIPENGTIFVSYYSNWSSDNRFDAVHTGYGASLSLFQNFIEVYTRKTSQDFENIEIVDPQTLKTIDQLVSGVRLNFWNISSGYEVDDMESNIIPYRAEKYFLNASLQAGNRLTLTLVGNFRKLDLKDVEEQQKFADMSGMLRYRMGVYSQVKVEGGWRQQRGRDLDLDLYSARLELESRWRQVFVTLGLEGFQRQLLSDRVRYMNSFLRISRRF